MKLITPAKIIKDEPITIVIEGYEPGLIGCFLGRKPRKKELATFEGRTRLSEATIAFGLIPCVIGRKRLAPIVFGNHLYEGIMPVQHIKDDVYVCCIDNVREVLIGEICKEAQDEPFKGRC